MGISLEVLTSGSRAETGQDWEASQFCWTVHCTWPGVMIEIQ